MLAAQGAGLLVVLLRYQWVPDFLQSPLAPMIVVAAFAASNVSQPKSGLLTATLMGVALANQSAVDVSHIVEFKEKLRVLLISNIAAARMNGLPTYYGSVLLARDGANRLRWRGQVDEFD